MADTPTAADFAKLLELLGREPGERISVCIVTDRFRPVVTTVGQAAGIVAGLAEVDCWYGANPLHERVPEEGSKGFMRDVVGIREVYADLDVKPGGMPSYEAARAVIADLAAMLGEYPTAVVASGHGLQPHWAIERGEGTDWPDETDPRWRRVVVLNRRWHRLVAHVCEARGGGLDNVSNLDRILRVPGTTNRKAEPVPVTVEFPGGAPVTLDRLAETLDEYGIAELPGDDEVLGEVVAEPGSWRWGGRTCPYVAAMVKAWGEDTPAARHPWLVSQAVRLAAAHRAGCITHADHERAVEALTARFRVLVGPGTPPRPGGKTGEQRGEIADALGWGRDKAATFADLARCLAELGNHRHELDLPGAEPGADRGAAEFWGARPLLATVRDYARARRCSPWAVLGVVLVRACAVIPPFVVLPALVGSYVSLNTYVGLVGPSGAGKDAATGAAVDVLDVGHVTTVGIGSGEGIAHHYVTYRKPNRKTGDPGGLEQHTTSVLFTAAEVDTLAALRSRQSSTLLPELRKAWTGTPLGFAYVDPEKRLHLPAHAYRLGLVVGIQPKRAAPLLDDTDGGTPQRFWWMPTLDPDAPEVRPDEPEPLAWRSTAWPTANGAGKVVLPVCHAARRTIDEARLARLRGEGDALDGHALLARLKLAAVFGILDGRAEAGEEDWHLAGAVQAVSDRTRARVVHTLDEARRQANRARGEAEAERSVIVAETVTDAAVKRVARTVRRKLGTEWRTASELRRAVTSADRGYVDAALDRLAEAGVAEVEPVEYRGQKGARYRLADGEES